MKTKRLKSSCMLLCLVIPVALTTGCTDTGRSSSASAEHEAQTASGSEAPCAFEPVAVLDDGWRAALPSEVGVDCGALEAAIVATDSGRYGAVHSLLVVKNQALIFERYWPGRAPPWDRPMDGLTKSQPVAYDRETRHDVASVTKSVTATLVGIALEKGLIRSFDQPLMDFFPDRAALFQEQTRLVTLRHLLTMTGGFSWNENDVPFEDPRNDLTQLELTYDNGVRNGNAVDFLLKRKQPIQDVPGRRFLYNGALTNSLADVVRQVSKLRLEEFADRNLFGPLGIQSRSWWTYDDDGYMSASGDLMLRPRDMAKIGALYAANGLWQGRRILPETWVQEATRSHVLVPESADDPTPSSAEQGYGFQWWTRVIQCGERRFETYFASGYGGQRIEVVPGADLVVVITGGNWNWQTAEAAAAAPKVQPTSDLVTEHVLPSTGARRCESTSVTLFDGSAS